LEHFSAFFDRPISIATVYSDTYRHVSSNLPAVPLSLPPDSATIAAASPDTPIVQKRQVHLQCSGKVVCTATSQVRITSPRCAHLNLVEKYAIGQTFSQMQMAPSFELVAVGFGPVVDDFPSEKTSLGDIPTNKQHQLWRRYILSIPGFECDILEVFPSRDMFVHGTSWLDNKPSDRTMFAQESHMQRGTSLNSQTSLTLFLGFSFLLVIALEVSMYFVRSSSTC
jgi:hypothetical protein